MTTLARGQLVLYIGANRSGGRISMIEVSKMLDAIEKEASRSGYQQHKDFFPEAEAALAAPATLPADDTRIVWKRDHGMVIVTGDEEPQSLEIPAWAVRTIFDVADKDPEEEARKVSAFINAHTGLNVERLHEPDALALDREKLARVLHRAKIGCWGPEPIHDGVPDAIGQTEVGCLVRWNGKTPSSHEYEAAAIAAAYDAERQEEQPDPLVTYTDPAGGPDWEPRRDER